jgi:hypothetical protein
MLALDIADADDWRAMLCRLLGLGSIFSASSFEATSVFRFTESFFLSS